MTINGISGANTQTGQLGMKQQKYSEPDCKCAEAVTGAFF